MYKNTCFDINCKSFIINHEEHHILGYYPSNIFVMGSREEEK